MDLYDELRAVLNALEQARVQYALVGGLAVAVWGAPRATKDIDLLVRREDLPAAAAAIAAIGFTLPGLPFTFKDGSELQRINKVDQDGNLMTVDFMILDRNLEPAFNRRVHLSLEQQHVMVVTREDLLAMKALAARPQDLADIQNLMDVDR